MTPPVENAKTTVVGPPRLLLALAAIAPLASLGACGRSRGVTDDQLAGLVVESVQADAPIDVAVAAREPAELGRALARPYAAVLAALGPHTTKLTSSTTVTEGNAPVSELRDETVIEAGERGAFHAVYTNSADYGREAIYLDGRLYLRPRYQRWHGRAPETASEPDELRDHYAGAAGATWDLLAPGVELTDRGPVQVGGRVGRKIQVGRSPTPAKNPAEPLAQRGWRETRTIEAVTGEVVLDAESGVPLAVKLTGKLGFTRDGRRFAMAVAVDTAVTGIGAAVAIAAPPAGEVVATPERAAEVDDRDFLLQGIAPPQRRAATKAGP